MGNTNANYSLNVISSAIQRKKIQGGCSGPNSLSLKLVPRLKELPNVRSSQGPLALHPGFEEKENCVIPEGRTKHEWTDNGTQQRMICLCLSSIRQMMQWIKRGV